eukprot:m.298154 g.298154  ORF g.298154 m.298154 type:complete len:358 (+) comp13794_c0_seq1:112-1185(+)
MASTSYMSGLRHRHAARDEGATLGPRTDDDKPDVGGDPDSDASASEEEDVAFLEDGQDGSDKTHVRASFSRRHGESDVELLWKSMTMFVSRSCTQLRDRLRRWMGTRRGSAGISDGFDSSSAEPFSDSAQAAFDVIDVAKKTAFLDDHDGHMGELRELWLLMLPDEPFERISPRWGELGFQGKDPATDFRGQGHLGLRNLLHVVRSDPARAREIAARDGLAFPFAIAVINVSSELLRTLAANPAVANRLFEGITSGDHALDVYDQLFSLVFLEFERFHADALHAFLNAGGNPAFAVMEFNNIRQRYFDTLRSQMRSGEFGTAFVRPARHRAASDRPDEATEASESPATREGMLVDLS